MQDNNSPPNRSVRLDIYGTQLHDNIIGPLLKVKSEGSPLTDDDLKGTSREFRQLAQQWDHLQLHNGLLHRVFEDNKGTTTILQLLTG